MKFSLIYEAQTVDASREGEHRVYDEMVEQCVLAEEMGFDVIWAVEHTALTNYAHMSAPESFLAFIAGRTRRIEIGHGVVCLPPAMNHPIKVAERIATLDLLSQGRLHFGVGKGGTQQESGAFGYDLDTPIGSMSVDRATFNAGDNVTVRRECEGEDVEVLKPPELEFRRGRILLSAGYEWWQ